MTAGPQYQGQAERGEKIFSHVICLIGGSGVKIKLLSGILKLILQAWGLIFLVWGFSGFLSTLGRRFW